MAATGVVPNLDDDGVWQSVCGKIDRPFPWLFQERHEVSFLGVGDGWRGKKVRGSITSESIMRTTPIFAINLVMTWLAHFFRGAMWMRRKNVAVVVAANPLPSFGFALARSLGSRIILVVRVQGFPSRKALFVRKLSLAILDPLQAGVLRSAVCGPGRPR